ncbi:MAG TPA: hypothetical protein VF520_16260 [Thermoleophilaceae bacterium]
MRGDGQAAVGAVLAALVAGLAWPGAAVALPASGQHATIDMWSSTKRPGASAALGYTGTYHAAGDPDGDPPALRRLTIQLPRGTRIDTSVPARCTASDDQIRFEGDSACPPASRVGGGEVTVRQLGLVEATYETVLYNAEDDLLEVVKSGDRVVGVVHTYVRGSTLDGPVPTCMMGGEPPDGCPFDQLAILSNRLQVDPVSIGRGAARRNYGTTPPTCPRSGRWRVRVTLRFADGSADAVTPQTPCRRPRRAARRR